MKNLLILLWAMIILALFTEVKAQARLVLNGAQLVLTNGAKLVLENPAANALTTTTGGLKCTSPNDALIWHTGTTAGTYTVPFLCRSNQPLPLTFTQSGGSGAGSLSLATYATPTWQNSLHLPAHGLHANTLTGADNSAHMADRFWQIAQEGYAQNPKLTTIVFAYAQTDADATGNSLTEAELQPFQWDAAQQNWRGYLGKAGLNAEANTVTIPEIDAQSQNRYWMLADNGATLLPVHFMQFTATANGTRVHLHWSTAMEENNHYFGVERTKDGRTFTEISRVPGAGTTQHQSHYATTDENPLQGQSYYRIKQVDFDGKFSYSPMRSVYFGASGAVVTGYPNPATTHQVLQFANWAAQPVTLCLTDLQGRQLLNQKVQLHTQNQTVRVNFPALPAGTYLLRISGAEQVITQKILIGK